MIPNVLRGASSPALPPSPGIVVTVDKSRDPRAALVVHGAFNLRIADGDAIGHPAHRAIVLVVWSFGYRYVATPFREQVLFADDEVGLPGGVGGYFNVDLFDLQGRAVPGDYHLYVTMGEYLSNVERASVR